MRHTEQIQSIAAARWALVAVVPLLAGGSAVAQETNAPCGGSQVPMVYGERAECSISPASDVDMYKFVGRAGETVRVTVAGKSYYFDPTFHVLSPDASYLVPAKGASTTYYPVSVRYDFMIAMDGIHYLAVYDGGNDETGDYALDLQRLPPLFDVAPIAYGGSASVGINHPSDHDWLRIEAASGTQIRVTAAGLSYYLDPQIELFDAQGNLVKKANCSTTYYPCSTSMDVTVTADGPYFLAVSDAGNDETGNISVSLNCLFGNCPPPNPPVPLGTAYCVQTVNSTGSAAAISALGSPVVAANNVDLIASNVPAGNIGIFFVGFGTANQPMTSSWGTLCVLPAVKRLSPAVFIGNNNVAHYQFDLTSAPYVMPGNPLYHQFWFRDPAGPPPHTSNTSDGLRIDYQ